MNLARWRLPPGFTCILFLAEALVASAMIFACTKLVLLVFNFHGVFLHSRVTGACPVTTELIMRVNVRTTTTTTTAIGVSLKVTNDLEIGLRVLPA